MTLLDYLAMLLALLFLLWPVLFLGFMGWMMWQLIDIAILLHKEWMRLGLELYWKVDDG